MKVETPVGTHKAVGPVTDMYDHGPVTIIQDPEVRDHDSDEGVTLFVCLNCGYTTHDDRLLVSEECDRSDNPVSQTWGEYLEADEYPE